MMTCHDVQAALSAFVDETTGAGTTRDIETHLGTCEACRGLADDLVRVRAAARALGPVAPPARVWTELSARLAAPDPAGSGSAAPAPRSAAWQWLGLAAALVLVTLGLYAVDRFRPAPAPAGNPVANATVEGVNEELRLALDHYENAISQLKVLAATGDDALDPDIAATFDRNMAIVDSAIDESRAALDADPGNQPARASLLEALSQKVNVLQSAVLLMNEMREGDPAGAVNAAGGTQGLP